VDLGVALSLLLGIFAGLYLWLVAKIDKIDEKLDVITKQLNFIVYGGTSKQMEKMLQEPRGLRRDG
jgi:hypothetical protein